MLVDAIIQARTSSTRLPNKIFAEIEGKPLIGHVVERLRWSKRINNIIIATTVNHVDDNIVEWSIENNILYYRGSEVDVLARYYDTAKYFGAEVIARITADDPFKDPTIIDTVIDMLFEKQLDFAYNNNPPSFPEGLDTEIFTFEVLEKAYKESVDVFEREHVTQYFYRNLGKFKQENYFNNTNISYLRWTIDKEKDLEMVKAVYKELYRPGEIFLLDDILNLIEKEPWISKINSDIKRSTMYTKLNNQ